MKPEPHKSLLNRNWKYTPSGETDVAATYRRIFREMKEKVKPTNLVPIRKEK